MPREISFNRQTHTKEPWGIRKPDTLHPTDSQFFTAVCRKFCNSGSVDFSNWLARNFICHKRLTAALFLVQKSVGNFHLGYTNSSQAQIIWGLLRGVIEQVLMLPPPSPMCASRQNWRLLSVCFMHFTKESHKWCTLFIFDMQYHCILFIANLILYSFGCATQFIRCV